MIFVCTGTQVYQFDRLLIELDRLVSLQQVDSNIFAQIGASTYKPKNYKYADYISAEEFKKYQETADLVISHGGTGALISALKLGKNVIAVPRLAKFNEHTDDHQLQIVRMLESQNYIRAVYDINDLSNVINDAVKNPISKVYKNESRIINIIQEYIDSL